MSLSTCYLEYGSRLAGLHRRRHRRRRRAARPRAIPLAMITMRKSTHGFPFVSHIWVTYGAPLGGPLGRRSSTIKWEIVLQVQKHIHAVFCLNLFRGWYKVLASFLEVWMKKI